MSEVDVNLKGSIKQFVLGYNKGIVLATITGRLYAYIRKSMERMQGELEQVLTAFEEIRATSESSSSNSERITLQLKEMLEVTNALTTDFSQRTQDIHKATVDAKAMQTQVDDLTEASKKIQSITGEITDISERTHVLAINASIEAARAGKAGDGFRIIAHEVGNLAGQTGDFADEISQTVSLFFSIMKSFKEGMGEFLTTMGGLEEQMKEAEATFQEHSGLLNETGMAVQQILSGVKEESLALNDGFGSLSSLFELLKENAGVVTEIDKAQASLDSLLSSEL